MEFDTLRQCPKISHEIYSCCPYDFCPHDFLFSPSRSALYCTISAILKSKVACISAFYPITNAVGYQNLTLDTTARNFIGGTFLPVSGDMTLGDIGINDSFAPLSDTLYTINAYGGTKALYVYVDAETGELVGGGEGWYLSDDLDNWDEESALTNHNSDSLSVGQMLVVSSSTDGAAIVSAGEVASADVELVLDTTARNFLVNCTPADITLGDVAPNSSFAALSDTLYTINQYGGTKALYVYVDAETGELVGGGEGWYLSDDLDNWDEESALTNYNSTAVPAGSGFVVSSSTDGAAIILPSPISE